MKIVTIIGARPQFIKASTVSRAISALIDDTGEDSIQEIIVHTGQHYDGNMSKLFFEELSIPAPQVNLNIGSGPHGQMTGRMLIKIEDFLIAEKPDWILVYGDTNSTLAGALAAAKLNMPVAHVEAGLRSFNRRMPEELNRVMTDHLARLLFVPNDTAVHNLKNEGISNGVVQCGDVMLDAFLFFKEKAITESEILDRLNITPGDFCLATLHRQENTDDAGRLASILSAFEEISRRGGPVILPMHPRTRKVMQENKICISQASDVRVIQPVGYLDMIKLESHASLVLTDSGGVQKEAYFAEVPCITLRDETEWVETVAAGVNILAGADKKAIIEACEQAKSMNVKLKAGIYGDGSAAEIIVQNIISSINER